jgi:hypothetical protein
MTKHCEPCRRQLSALCRVFGLAALLVVIALPLAAQVNTEKMRLAKQSTGFSGELGSAMEFHTGNVEYIDIGLKGRLDFDDSLWLAFITGNFQLRSQSKNVFDRSGFIHARYNRSVSPWMILETFAQQEYNKSLRLKNRSLLGAGARIPAITDDDLVAILGSSWMYEYEERSDYKSGDEPPITRVHRWNTYVVLRYLGIPRVQFSNTVYFQPRVGHWSDLRILDEGALNVELSRTLSITNSLAFRFDHEPPPGVRQSDLAFRTGILFSF